MTTEIGSFLSVPVVNLNSYSLKFLVHLLILLRVALLTMKLSLILSTYNRPDAVEKSLQSLMKQNDKDFELLVADDGSTAETRELLNSYRSFFKFGFKHIWQEDLGFRLSASRNNALRQARGDYIVFLDGDCLANPEFIANHRKLAEPGFFVTGNRILASPSFTKQILAANDFSFPSLGTLFRLKRNKEINKAISGINFPRLDFLRKLYPQKWQRLRGCNFAAWRKDIFAVNGFDEDFVGWGFEDSDFAVRMINNKIYRKSGNFATAVLHLYHPEGNKAKEGPSWEKLSYRLKHKESFCANGLIKSDC